jgi:hypothetical protein
MCPTPCVRVSAAAVSGCYTDTPARAVPTLLLVDPGMTVQMCAELAYASISEC